MHKVKLYLSTPRKHKEGVEAQFHSLTPVAEGDDWPTSCPSHLTAAEITASTCHTEAGHSGEDKNLLSHPGIKSQTTSPQTSH